MPRPNTRPARAVQARPETRLDEATLVAANASRLRAVLERNLGAASEPELITRLRTALDLLARGQP